MKENVIRNKCSEIDHIDRVSHIERMLVEGFTRAQILTEKKVVSWGVSDRQIDNYLKLAKEGARKALDEDRESIYAMAIKRYDRIYQKALAENNLKEANNAVTNQLKALGYMQNNFLIQQNNQTNFYNGLDDRIKTKGKVADLIEELSYELSIGEDESNHINALLE